MRKDFSSEGIVLSRKNYGEADRIISVFSKNHGRISLLAKGIRRPKSKKRGHLEIFSLIRFQAREGAGIGFLTEVEIVDDFSAIRKSLNKISLAYYICEVTGKITHENEKNTDLFDLIYNSLSELTASSELKKLRLTYIYKLLVMMGYWPEGKELLNPDEYLEEVIEREIKSVRVGKRMLK